MKVAIGAIAAAVLALIAGTIWLAAGVREETVVSNPYEEGLKLGHGHHAGGAAAPSCDLGSSPCALPLAGGGEVRVELGPRPLVTMKELAVRVDLGAGAPPAEVVSVSFSMPGMTMGENRVRLARTGPGRFEGKAVLVRCPSGGRAWAADVEVAGPGAPARSARFAVAVGE
jgi:hypothetical protein